MSEIEFNPLEHLEKIYRSMDDEILNKERERMISVVQELLSKINIIDRIINDSNV